MTRALELSWAEHGGAECLRVRGWAVDELERFRAGTGDMVAVLPGDLADVGALEGIQPIAGTFLVDGDDVWFQPRFPFRPGLRYTVLVAVGRGTWRAPQSERSELTRPAPACRPTSYVTLIHPASHGIPLNLLKFYVEFSAPMSEGFARHAITLRRADGSVIADAFAPMEPELWDGERRRLTVLLDPGRIKRGLAPHEQAGYPLVEGQRVTLHIDASFRDARGVDLIGPATRTFDVGPAIRELVVPRCWQLTLPPPDTLEPFAVRFGRPLDHALLRHCISVVAEAGAPLDGRAEPFEGDEGWRFSPSRPWRRGRYDLAVEPWLEDLAGNSVRRLFDRDLTSDPPADPDASTVPWQIR